MAVWSGGIELWKGQPDSLWKGLPWTQQSGGFTGTVVQAHAGSPSWSPPLGNTAGARCHSVPTEPACPKGRLSGHGCSSELLFGGHTLWRNNSPAGYGRIVTSETVSMLCEQGQLAEAVEALGVLVETAFCVSRSLFYAVLKECVLKKDVALGRRIHAFTVKTGFGTDTFICNHILRMYASHGRLQDAMDVFTMVATPDAFMWSSLISAHVKQGEDEKAIQLYHGMRRSGVRPDGHVFVAALQACARKGDLITGQQLHADVLAVGVELDLFVCSCLVGMYAKCGSLEDARRVFDGLGRKDVVTWNAMISGYSQQGMAQEALRLYRAMRAEGCTEANSVTFACLLQACASEGSPALELGKQFHVQIREQGRQTDVLVGNSLVNMYAKCGSLADAKRVFDGLGRKDVATWNAMIAGYSHQGLGWEALCVYTAMGEEGNSTPDSLTFVCLLQACARLGTPALEKGRQIHVQIREQGYQADNVVVNSLVNMYAKCGSLEDARSVFDGFRQKDVVMWNAIIAGYSQQGMGQEAIRLFWAMQEEAVAVPDSVTFVCVLRACACVGNPALEIGKRLHVQIKEQGLQADESVANSLVTMYAKCGSLEDAQSVFDVIDRKSVVTWNAMIAGYSQQGMGQEALCVYTKMAEESNTLPNSVTFVCLLQACACIGTSALEKGRQLHAQIKERGNEADSFVANSLVNMYAKCGSLADAQKLFDKLGYKDVVTWNAMMRAYSQQGKGWKALRLYGNMQTDSTVVPDSVTFVCLLQACAGIGMSALEFGKQLETQIREQGHLADQFVVNSLVNMYAKCGSLEDARRVFDGLCQKDVVTWNSIIAGYSQQGLGQEALCLYTAMQEEGMTVPNPVTFVSLMQACASVGAPALAKGKQLHVQIEEQGHEADVFVASCLVNMYVKCGSLADARRVFDGRAEKDVVIWTAMIAGYSQQGMGQEALCLYSAMQKACLAVPDSVTFACLLQACASVGSSALKIGKQLHSQIRERGHEVDVFVASSLVNMYAKCGSLERAQRVFDGLGQKDVVTWTAMIAGCSQQGMGQEAIRLYSAMQNEGVAVSDSVTFVSLLQACAGVGAPALEIGRQLHVQIKERGYLADVFVANSLVNMYAKCGSLEDARSVFNRLVQKDVVTWNTMITGYSQQGRGPEALRLYSEMQDEKTAEADSVMFVTLLQSCANVADLHLGRRLHMQIKEQGLQDDLIIAGSLINMYGKSGSMVEAQQVFDALSVRDTVAWSALVAGYTCQGDSEAVFALVQRMEEDGLQPDSITFLSVLTVCNHASLVTKGRDYFEAMSNYGITPTADHYTCMVDLLGRAGRLDEALALVRTMPVLPNAAVWHTLLSACRKWSNVEVGCDAFNQAVQLEKNDAAAYVLMSSIYTGAQMWERAEKMQARRKGVRAWKEPGQSWWTDADGQLHSFLAKRGLDTLS